MAAESRQRPTFLSHKIKPASSFSSQKLPFSFFFYKNIYARKNLLSLSLFRAAATKE
jgi:hypothetical protein